MKTFNPNDKVTVELDAQSWNLVMDQLYDGRYRIVAPIIANISAQFQNAAGPSLGDNIVPMGAAE